jgi:hypothetical protein
MNRLPRSIIALILASFCYVANGQLSLGVEALDHEFWVSVKDSGDPKEFQEYLKVFPEGFFAGLAKIKIKRLKSKKALTGQESGVVRKLKNDLKSLDKALVRARAEISKLTEEKTALLITQQELKGQVESLSDEERDALTTQVTLLEVTRAVLQTETSALRDELEGLLRSAVSTERALEASKQTGEDLARRLAETALDYKLTKEELAYLRAEYTQEVGDFEKQRRLLIAAHQQELDILRERHSDLEVQYNRLIRPARSTVGRHVVEVRFWKEGSEYHYSVREPGQGRAQSVSVVELHQVLAARKAQYGDKLYTKVQFPYENSITQGEGWRFTVEMHNRYDYYYQN